MRIEYVVIMHVLDFRQRKNTMNLLFKHVFVRYWYGDIEIDFFADVMD